jgi:NAD(P)H-hydrate epimerase
MPSGLFSDSPAVPGPAVKAHLTVTFTALKPALLLPPAADRAGRVVVAPIGSPCTLLENPDYRMNLIDAHQARAALPPRPRDSHKGSFGHVFVVAGSRGKSGAALMTGLAALRSGAGLVTLYLPRSLQRDVVGKVPELMTESIPETPEGTAHTSAAEAILKQAAEANVLAVGPGMTTNRSTQELIRTLVQQSPIPVVLDADGINAFEGKKEILRNQKRQPVVITPHPGEMARLLKTTIARVQADRIETARRCSQASGAFSILKGFQTVVATPTGQIFINNTGNPGMATAGSGDILAGILARFVAGWSRRFRGADLIALADHISAAVYFHGVAGDLAAEQKGVESMIATDLLAHLPEAFKRVVSE